MGVEFQKKVGSIFSNNVQGHLEVIEVMNLGICYISLIMHNHNED